MKNTEVVLFVLFFRFLVLTAVILSYTIFFVTIDPITLILSFFITCITVAIYLKASLTCPGKIDVCPSRYLEVLLKHQMASTISDSDLIVKLQYQDHSTNTEPDIVDSPPSSGASTDLATSILTNEAINSADCSLPSPPPDSFALRNNLKKSSFLFRHNNYSRLNPAEGSFSSSLSSQQLEGPGSAFRNTSVYSSTSGSLRLNSNIPPRDLAVKSTIPSNTEECKSLVLSVEKEKHESFPLYSLLHKDLENFLIQYGDDEESGFNELDEAFRISSASSMPGQEKPCFNIQPVKQKTYHLNNQIFPYHRVRFPIIGAPSSARVGEILYSASDTSAAPALFVTRLSSRVTKHCRQNVATVNLPFVFSRISHKNFVAKPINEPSLEDSLLYRGILNRTERGTPCQCLVELRYCSFCSKFQPLRTKHCTECGTCIRTKDHHCPWLGNCIGEKNFFYFYWYLAFQCMEFAWINFLTCRILFFSTVFNQLSFIIHLQIALIMIFLVCVALMVMVIGLFAYHTFLILTNMTTWENIAWYDITYLKHLSEFEGSPFSRGIMGNLNTFCLPAFLCCSLRHWGSSLIKLGPKGEIIWQYGKQYQDPWLQCCFACFFF